jgi:hypothetical protein
VCRDPSFHVGQTFQISFFFTVVSGFVLFVLGGSFHSRWGGISLGNVPEEGVSSVRKYSDLSGFIHFSQWRTFRQLSSFKRGDNVKVPRGRQRQNL